MKILALKNDDFCGREAGLYSAVTTEEAEEQVVARILAIETAEERLGDAQKPSVNSA